MGISKLPEWKPPPWNKEYRKIYSWCLKHGVKIYPVPASKGQKNKTCYIEVNVNGKKTMSPSTYNTNELWVKVFELYKFYYDKHTN